MHDLVWFDDDFPILVLKTARDDEPTFRSRWTVVISLVEHVSNIDLVKPAINHSLEQVRCEFELPLPLLWPIEVIVCHA